ncbi:MAG: type II secretion system F family protein [Gammaproteobacteria bacterium]|nr:type II secretion system F family protein [Rhodocyclaceae bacterium]MBU3908216.1 type II secretion system F family protein [Gammaproteobacteria bacterium]MBU4003147.1 type II secretion system F family protein [Gammaproteobacteria bacterium]MBU4019989.1 type II secretion system F family protein [Gammaproteobacteria bacterium]MBU4096845.1 type II secretion system F family protein [Gammaproteobacteria bacterium]
MSLYSYKAMDASGRLVFGRMDAINPVDLEMRLKRMDLDFINGGPVKQSRWGGMKINRRELITFCFHLEQLSRAGVPIIESLTDLRDSLENPRFREVLAGLIESVEGGKTLSQAMSEHPQVFDGVFISLVKAGEESGNLTEVLHNLSETLKWQDELAAQTKKLVMYPAFMGTVVILVTLFMMLYLVPKMVGFIKNMGQELPLHTQILIATSNFFVNYWYIAIGLPIIVASAIAVAVKTNPRARYRFDAAKLSFPWIGEILTKIILSRFAGVFAMMYASGISILDSIRTTQGIVGNVVIQEGLQRVEEMIGEGQNVTVAFQNAGLFPPLVIRMLKVGENTGSLDTALTNVSYFYNRDVRESISRVQAMIEPAMTIVVGVILGWVMLSVLGPIYDTITKLKF